MKRRNLIAYCGMLALGGAGASPAYACRLFPPNSIDHYRARQDEHEIGFQTISFFHEQKDFVVSTQQKFQYRNYSGKTIDFSHSAREVWTNGWLNRFESTTRHGERDFAVTAETVDLVTMLVRSSASQIPSLVTGYVVPGNVWHRDSRLVNRFMDMVDGQLKLVKVVYAGKELLPVAGSAQVTNHYQLRGEMNLDAWYNEKCQLVRTLLPFKRAEPVVFDLV